MLASSCSGCGDCQQRLSVAGKTTYSETTGLDDDPIEGISSIPLEGDTFPPVETLNVILAGNGRDEPDVLQNQSGTVIRPKRTHGYEHDRV